MAMSQEGRFQPAKEGGAGGCRTQEEGGKNP